MFLVSFFLFLSQVSAMPNLPYPGLVHFFRAKFSTVHLFLLNSILWFGPYSLGCQISLNIDESIYHINYLFQLCVTCRTDKILVYVSTPIIGKNVEHNGARNELFGVTA